MKFVKIFIVAILLACIQGLTTTSKTTLKTQIKSGVNFKMNTIKLNNEGGMSVMEFLNNAMEKNQIGVDKIGNANTIGTNDELSNVIANANSNEIKEQSSVKKLSSSDNLISSPTNTKIITRPKRKQKDPNALLADDNDLKLFKESWLSISYKALESSGTFPTLLLPDLSESWISVGASSVRENKQYDASKVSDSNYPPTKYSVYVRLSGRNLFYSNGPKDMLVFGSLPLDGLIKTEKIQKSTEYEKCFKVFDKRNIRWKLCALTAKLRDEWVCILKRLLKDRDREECKPKSENEPQITYYDKKVNQAIILIPLAAPHCNQGWNYNSNGQDWECDCKEGIIFLIY